MKNQTPTLSDAELDTVNGGEDSLRQMSFFNSLLTSIQQMQHETIKAVTQNLRA